MTPDARAWLAQPALTRLWDGLRDRLERNGLQARGRVRIDGATPTEREALSLLTGRPCTGDQVSIALADLDTALRSGAAECGLVDVVRELRGPLTDRPGARDARRTGKEMIWSAAERALQAHALHGVPWAEPWLEELRRAGTLTRLDPPRAAQLIVQAIDVLALLRKPAALGRGELAERVTGTAHGLDDDTLLARIVLRGIAHMLDAEPPGTRVRDVSSGRPPASPPTASRPPS